MSYSVAISVFSLGGWRKGRGGCLRNIGHEHDFSQAQKAENTDPCTNDAVKYATARGHLMRVRLLWRERLIKYSPDIKFCMVNSENIWVL